MGDEVASSLFDFIEVRNMKKMNPFFELAYIEIIPAII